MAQAGALGGSVRPPVVGPEVDRDTIDLLVGVVLKSFTTTPDLVAPFGTAILAWEVEAPVGVFLRLQGKAVPLAGSEMVRPEGTSVYNLFAHTRRASLFLAAVTIRVPHDRCITSESTLVDELLVGALNDQIENDPKTYFRLVAQPAPGQPFNFVPSVPVVKVEPGRIGFQLALGAVVDDFPNPDVDIDASFGLAVVPDPEFGNTILTRTKLVAAHVSVRVKVSFPWWAYLVPAAPLLLPIRASMEEDSARVRIVRGIEKFVDQGLDALLFKAAPPGFGKHGVKILPDSGGTVLVEFCPAPEPGVGPASGAPGGTARALHD
jgi:hypothetical protein